MLRTKFPPGHKIHETKSRGGKATVERKLGIHAQTKDERIKNSTVGGHRAQELYPNLASETLTKTLRKYPQLARNAGLKGAHTLRHKNRYNDNCVFCAADLAGVELDILTLTEKN